MRLIIECAAGSNISYTCKPESRKSGIPKSSDTPAPAMKTTSPRECASNKRSEIPGRLSQSSTRRSPTSVARVLTCKRPIDPTSARLGAPLSAYTSRPEQPRVRRRGESQPILSKQQGQNSRTCIGPGIVRTLVGRAAYLASRPSPQLTVPQSRAASGRWHFRRFETDTRAAKCPQFRSGLSLS